MKPSLEERIARLETHVSWLKWLVGLNLTATISILMLIIQLVLR